MFPCYSLFNIRTQFQLIDFLQSSSSLYLHLLQPLWLAISLISVRFLLLALQWSYTILFYQLFLQLNDPTQFLFIHFLQSFSSLSLSQTTLAYSLITFHNQILITLPIFLSFLQSSLITLTQFSLLVNFLLLASSSFIFSIVFFSIPRLYSPFFWLSSQLTKVCTFSSTTKPLSASLPTTTPPFLLFWELKLERERGKENRQERA